MPDGSKNRTTGALSAAPHLSEVIRNWLDVVAKLVGAVAVAFVTYVVSTYQQQASISSVINQREQAESQLRASMLSDLVEPIIGKDGTVTDNTDLKRQLLLAEMVTLNFHDHFEFKPLLEQVDSRLQTEDPAGHEKIASVARRVVDRQINMLTSIDGISRNGDVGYPAKVVSVTLWKPENPAQQSSSGNCTIESQLVQNATGILTMPASVCISSPDRENCLDLSFYWDSGKNSLVMSTSGYPKRFATAGCAPRDQANIVRQDGYQNLDESSLSIFDFPLTDNVKISFPYTNETTFPLTSLVMWKGKERRREYRFAASIYRIKNFTINSEKGDRIELRLVWFPEGYVTERERPPPRSLR